MPDNRLVPSYVRSTGAITSKETYGQTRYKSDRSATARRRTLAQAQGGAGGGGASTGCYAAIGKRLGRQLAAVNGAIGKLRSKPLGRPRHLHAAQCEALRRMLLQGALVAGFPTELWTIKRVRALIKREFGVTYSSTGGWELLRSLGFTPQKPERRALHRNEQAIVQWKRKQWPALKKRPIAKDEPSSS
jgi:transposase